jgi:hypothetical protein
MARTILIIVAVLLVVASAIATMYVLGIRSGAQPSKLQPVVSTMRSATRSRFDRRACRWWRSRR